MLPHLLSGMYEGRVRSKNSGWSEDPVSCMWHDLPPSKGRSGSSSKQHIRREVSPDWWPANHVWRVHIDGEYRDRRDGGGCLLRGVSAELLCRVHATPCENDLIQGSQTGEDRRVETGGLGDFHETMLQWPSDQRGGTLLPGLQFPRLQRMSG